MEYEGNIQKMRSVYDNPVKYYLPIGDKEIFINDLIGKEIKIEYHERINCIKCNALTKKSFHQGYCYSCYTSVPECDTGVLRPETDMSHLGISRDMEWSKKNSLIDHYVYIAITGDLKVGVTRYTQIPTRWIDQGAIYAIKLAKTPYRNLAGLMETELKKYVSDKTNKTKMLLTHTAEIDLKAVKSDLITKLPEDFSKYVSYDNSITKIKYPFDYSLSGFSSLSLDKQNQISGKLKGIKGQYLIFSTGNIFNIRSHNGYYINIEVS